MNLIPLAALLIAALAFATAVTAIVLVERLRRAYPTRRRQYQVGGAHSVQVQTGGSLTIDETADHRAERIAKETLRTMGRHL